MAAGVFIERPGPYRAITPDAFGTVAVAPDIYTDAPGRAEELIAMVREAEERSAAFFSIRDARPVYILCTRAACRGNFGLTARGLTLGYLYVLISPSGIRPVTLLHERIHVDLHYRMGITDIFFPRFPSWFNEGLATYLSGGQRTQMPANARDADWVAEADTILGWKRVRRRNGTNRTYAAAARLVQEIDERIGRDGLAALVDRVAGGADFDTEYARALGR